MSKLIVLGEYSIGLEGPKRYENACEAVAAEKRERVALRRINARMRDLLERIHADADSQYEGGSNNGQAKFSAELYQDLCEFVGRLK